MDVRLLFFLALGLVSCAPAPAPALYFPAENADWETVSLQSSGWNEPALEQALDFAAEHNSTAVVILYRGKILAERYWEIDDPPLEGKYRYRFFRVGSTLEGHPIEDVASIQKSVISLLAAVAIERGHLDRKAPVSNYLGAGWSKAADAEGQILVQHLLSMSSGLTDSLEYEAPAGTHWYYNTYAYSQLIKVLARVSQKEVNACSNEWLTGRLGMNDSRWVLRPGVTEASNPHGFGTTARDLARMGLLVLSGGSWRGEPIIPSDYLGEALQSSQPLNPAYGLLWWVNGQSDWQDWDHKGLLPGSFIPTAPDDLVAARGIGDHKLYVVPSLDLVVTRLGSTAKFAGEHPEVQFFDREFWRRLMAAAP